MQSIPPCFFSVTIDELISPDEVVSAAQAERRSLAVGYASLVCGLLDVLAALLLVVPVFGNGTEGPTTVSLLALIGVSPWVRAVFSACVGATVLCGFCELAVSRADGRWGEGGSGCGGRAFRCLRGRLHPGETALCRYHLLRAARDEGRYALDARSLVRVVPTLR